jgi:chromosome segregation ATPase
MDKEIVFKTKVDTGNTVKDIDNVRNSIKSTEVEVEKLSKKYGENSKEADDQRKILASLNIEYAKLTKSTTDLNAKFDDVYGGIQPLTGRLGELEDRMYELALAGQKNTQEFKDLQTEVVKYKKTIVDVDTSVDNLAQRGKHLQGALAIGAGVVAGYGAVQSAMALVGSDSKELEKTLVKLTAVTTLLNSVNEIRALFEKQSAMMVTLNAVKTGVMTVAQYAYTTAVGTTTGAMKLLRLSMLAIPIFAIIAGVMALVSAMDLFGESTEEATAKQKAFDEMQAKSLKKSQDYLTNGLKSKQETHDKEIELMKAKGASSDEIYKKEKENLELTQRQLEKQVTFGIKMNAEQYKLYKDTLQAKKVLEATHQKELTDEQEKGVEEQKKNFEKRKAERLQSEKDKQQKLLELQRLTQDLINTNIEDSGLRQLAQLRTQHEREYTDLIAKYGKNQKLIDELTVKQFNETQALKDDLQKQSDDKEKAKLEKENINQKASLEAKILNLRADFEAEQGAKIQLADMELAQALQNKELTDGEIEKLHAEHKAKIDAINEDSKNKEIENQKAIRDAGFEIANNSLSSIQSLTDTVFSIKQSGLRKGSEEELKSAKKQFEINKQMQIAQAIINGAQSVIKAVMDNSQKTNVLSTIGGN